MPTPEAELGAELGVVRPSLSSEGLVSEAKPLQVSPEAVALEGTSESAGATGVALEPPNTAWPLGAVTTAGLADAALGWAAATEVAGVALVPTGAEPLATGVVASLAATWAGSERAGFETVESEPVEPEPDRVPVESVLELAVVSPLAEVAGELSPLDWVELEEVGSSPVSPAAVVPVEPLGLGVGVTLKAIEAVELPTVWKAMM